MVARLINRRGQPSPGPIRVRRKLLMQNVSVTRMQKLMKSPFSMPAYPLILGNILYIG